MDLILQKLDAVLEAVAPPEPSEVTLRTSAVVISLVLAQGIRFMGYQAGQAVVIDSMMVVLVATYLVSNRRLVGRAQPDQLST